jgi:DNA uptake protein ComE-like DNA-binding protein
MNFRKISMLIDGRSFEGLFAEGQSFYHHKHGGMSFEDFKAQGDVEIISDEPYEPPKPSDEELKAQAEAIEKRKAEKAERDAAAKPVQTGDCPCKADFDKRIAALEAQNETLKHNQNVILNTLEAFKQRIAKLEEKQANGMGGNSPQNEAKPQPALHPAAKKVNINTEMDVNKIEALPHFGLKGAQNVLEERKKGLFKDEADLVRRMHLRVPIDFKGMIEY